MGVITKRNVVCETGSISSNQESVQNSGYTTQEEEDQSTTDCRTFNRNRKFNLIEFTSHITRNSGRRRIQRVLNKTYLETLREESEPDDLVVSTKSKFQILMENSECGLELLNEYELHVEEMTLQKSLEKKERNLKNPYLNIPRRLRAIIKKHFKYDVIKTIEETVCQHILPKIASEYFYYLQTFYERLLVHAVAKYKGYHSETTIKDGRKAVRITNVGNEIPPTQLLCDYLKDMHSVR